MNWPLKRLGDVCDTTSGGTPLRSRTEYYGGEIPWIKSGDLNDSYIASSEEKITQLGLQNSSAKVFPSGTVLLAMYGATVGKLGILEIDAATNQAICGITPSSDIDCMYLFYFLLGQRKSLIGMSTGGAQPNISQRIVRDIRLPVPPMEEQRRIVDLLSRAEGIVRLRRVAQAKAQAIIPALFLDMFGDPAANPKGWPVRTVREIVARFEGGKNIQAGSEGDASYRILKVSAVTTGCYLEEQSKPAPEDLNPPRSHFVQVGDMLFSRANTQELVGATAVVEATDGKTLLPDKLWRFVWAEPVDQRYMHSLFQSRHVRRELGRLSTGTSASMRNISQEKLFLLQVPVAPLDAQRAFGRQAEALQSVATLQNVALDKVEHTFQSLLARAFSGDLTTATPRVVAA